jgi:hypothetical protein
MKYSQHNNETEKQNYGNRKIRLAGASFFTSLESTK